MLFLFKRGRSAKDLLPKKSSHFLGGRWRTLKQFLITVSSLLLVGLLVSIGATAGVSPSLVLSAPYRGQTYVNKTVTTTPGCAQDHFYSPPKFDKKTGVASVTQESKVNGARCPSNSTTTAAYSYIQFTSRLFSHIGGNRSIVVTWNVSWTANLSEMGGSNKTWAAGYSIGVSYTWLCGNRTVGCVGFQNGGGSGIAGSAGHYPWSAAGWVPSGKGRHLSLASNQSYSDVVKVYLNTTLNSSVGYSVLASLDMETTARAAGASNHATCELWMDAKLLSIAVS
jgi:hypothetical protein